MSKQEKFFQAGTVIGIHGLRGHLKVRPTTEGSQSLIDASTILLATAEGNREYQPISVKYHKGNLLILLVGIEGCEQAETLRGCSVLMPFVDLPDISSDEHYWHQIENFEVIDVKHGSLGHLKGLIATGAHDLYEVQGPFGEVLIPAVSEMVQEVDVAAGVIRVDLPEGLLDLTDED